MSAGLAGMTVQQRLAVRGSEAAFAEAVRARDRAAMVLLLKRAVVRDADRVADTILADPAAYGY